MLFNVRLWAVEAMDRSAFEMVPPPPFKFIVEAAACLDDLTVWAPPLELKLTNPFSEPIHLHAFSLA